MPDPGNAGKTHRWPVADQPDTPLRLSLRSLTDARKILIARAMFEGRAEIISGDLADLALLIAQPQGVDVAVSAVVGGQKVIVDGKVALAEAGERNGVRRILPSDFALYLFKATPSEYTAFDARRTADDRMPTPGSSKSISCRAASRSRSRPAWAPSILMPAKSPYSAMATVRSRLQALKIPREWWRASRSVVTYRWANAFAGDRVSFREAGETVSARIGRALRAVSYGSKTDLRAAMAAGDLQKRVMLAYVFKGHVTLSELQNNRDADLKLGSFAHFTARRMSAKKVSDVL